MFRIDRRDPVAARQGRRRRTFFEQRIEHGIRTARHGESVSKDHDRRSSRVHVDRAYVGTANHDGFTFSTFGNRERTGVNSDARTRGFSGSTGNLTRDARRFTRGESVTFEALAGASRNEYLR